MRMRFVLGLALLSAVGCGGSSYRFAPVSGKITLDGKPLAGASVNFQPIAVGSETGPGSAGKTNEKGEYSLTSTTGASGAWVGKHRVFVSVLTASKETTGDERGGPKMTNKVPDKYNGYAGETTLNCEVPPAGTNKADFELRSR
jgi:hypothetical protein